MKPYLKLTATALLALSLSTHADQTVVSADGKTEAIVHDFLADYRPNSEGVMLAQAYVTLRSGESMSRVYMAVSGCDKRGGVIGTVSRRANTIVSQEVWIAGGGSVRDSVAATVCITGLNSASTLTKSKRGM